MSGTSGKEPAAPKKIKPATRPFSIRLTDDEKRLLIERAGELSLGTYVRGLILRDGECQVRRRIRRSRTPTRDDVALARVLAALGQSRIANNLNQIAKAVNIGVLPVTPETDYEIAEACSAVIGMRRELMHALGLLDGSMSSSSAKTGEDA